MEFSEKEVKVIKKALDTLVRVHLGQASTVMDPVSFVGIRSDGRTLTSEECSELREHLERASEILTGIRHGGPGIYSPIVSDEARIAFRTIGKIEGDKLRLTMVDEDGKRL